MDSFPADIAFRKTWRTYQARVLSELERYLDDNHLHVIAAPGSGKTVLGLEVARRLKRATLIFSPTIAIRDQWVERLLGLFSEPGRGVPDWISKDINRPGHLTVSTYQGLHSAWAGRAEAEEDGEEEEAESEGARGSNAGGEKGLGRERLLQRLREAGVGTLVLDEAHHLRNEWWKCLIGVKEALEEPTVVALTATPPFDVTEYEWRRYTDLCGPVDSEISVPELVQERNLCPHQDYVYLSRPLRTEKAEIDEFRAEAGELVEGIFADGQFADLLASHRCVRQPKAHVEEILADPGFYSSMAFFLNHVTGRAPKELLRLIGISPRACPKRNSQWVEELLTGCLYSHAKSFGDGREVFARIGRDLKRIGAIERRRVRLQSTGRITKLLASSVSKLESIERIVELESGLLSGELRMVILTDFIRRPDLPRNVGDIEPLKRIGVVPIFEQIRRSGAGDVKLGILSGTLVVIPSVSRRLLEEIAAGMSIEAGDIRYTPLAHDGSFVEVGISGADRQKMVRLITRLFGRGGVTVLVGTKSLLGEGWDAPSLNSLVLASFVGSYMLSNQMRGRAIRVQQGNPEKTANIWHLVCVEQGRSEASEDLETLGRRFKSFVGVSFKETAIENGLERLDIGRPPFGQGRIERINSLMEEKACDRARLRAEWEAALEAGDVGAVAEEVAGSYFTLPRNFVFANTILAVLWQGVSWGLATFSYLVRSSEGAAERRGLRATLLLFGIAFAAGAVVALPKCLKAVYLFLRHGPVASSMKQIGKALVRALAHGGIIETDVSKLKVVTSRRKYGFVNCSLEGGTTRERSIFLDAMQEILGPIGNPRYILVRKTRLWRLLRRDYHVVPSVLGRNKELAEYFGRMWGRRVGAMELIYTRTAAGRRMLLKARGAAMSAGFQRRCERVRSWK